jgi:hypothetical protein
MQISHPVFGQNITPSPTARCASYKSDERDLLFRRGTPQDKSRPHCVWPCACCVSTGATASRREMDEMDRWAFPRVSDRIAQMVVKRHLEPSVEPVFHEDSYGYRPGRSAHQALAVARQRCWRYDWMLYVDVKGSSPRTSSSHQSLGRLHTRQCSCRRLAGANLLQPIPLTFREVRCP